MAMIDLGKLGFDLVLNKDDWNKDFKEADGDIEQHQSKWKGLASNIGGGIKAGIVSAVVGIDAAVTGMVVGGVGSAEKFQKALNGLQAETGSTDEAMKEMGKSILSIYNGNFGESFEDIAKSMSDIKKATGLTGEELEATTQNAIMLRDTFGMEVTESINGVNQLMDQFGMSSDEAFNLIAQGSQQGLDSTGELNDSIKEYSVQYAGLGLSAEDMFNSFKNGADAGVYSVDKIGDSIKEFGIRAKDGSKTSIAAFEALGLNADELTQKFNTGGTQGKEAFEMTTKAIMEMEDPVLQNQVGVALFGTMWEDVGVKGIAALTNLEGGIDSSTDALEKINEVKYNTFGEAIEGLKRNFETGILLPLGQYILPILGQFSTWIAENMPMIQERVSIVMGFIGGIFTTVKDAISDVINALKDWGTNNSETVEKFKVMFEGFKTWFSETFNSVAEIVADVWEIIKIIWDTYGNDIMNIVQSYFGYIQAIITTVINVIKDVINIVLALIKGDWEGVWNGIKTFISNLWNGIKNIFQASLNVIGSIIKIGFNVVKNIITSIWNGIKTFISNTFNNIRTSLSNFTSNFIRNWTSLWNNVKAKASEIWGNIKSGVSNFLGGLVTTITGKAGSFLSAGRDMFNSIWEGMKGIWDSISTWVGEKVSWIADKLAFWRSSNNEMDEGAVNGSHFNGLDSVPYDGYIARLHRHERVLTAEENKAFMRGELGNGGSGLNISIENFVNNRKQDVKALAEELEFYRRQSALGKGGV